MSKKKRKSRKRVSSRRQRSKRANDPSPVHSGPLPDQRALEGVMWQHLRDSGMMGDQGHTLAQAQEMVYQAYESEDPGERLELAVDAIDLCPDCAEAYVCLAELAPTAEAAETMYRMGIEAGERSLGLPDAFDQYEGHFWGILDTRPYMRARLGLAQCLWGSGQRDEAMRQCEDLLRLNPGDNQGVRYVLASYYCDLGRDEELAQLLDRYEDDGTAGWAFGRALLAFRREGDTESSRQLLCQAHEKNPHVAKYLLGYAPISDVSPDYVELGGPSEAMQYVSANLSGWRATSGAISWFRRTLHVTPPSPPRPARRPAWRCMKASTLELPMAEGEVWQVDVRRTGIGNRKAEGLKPLWTLVVTNPVGDEILALGMPEMDVKPPPNDVLMELVDIMGSPPSGDPRRPERIQVRWKTYQTRWAAKLKQLGIRCELCESLDHIDYVIGRMESLADREHPSADELRDRADELADLPQNIGECWQADIRKLAVWISEEGDPVRPWTTLVTSRTKDLILAQELAMEQPGEEHLWSSVLAAMLSPLAGEPHLPGVIEVASADCCEALSRYLEPLGVRCVVAEQLDQLDVVVDEMGQSLAEPDQPSALIDTPGVRLTQVEGFFDAASEYYKAQPWRNAPSDAALKVHCDKLQTSTWYVVVMGQSGMTLGLAMYEDLEVLQALLRQEPGAERRNSGLSVMYGEAFEIAIRDLDAAEQNGWPVAGPEAYPLILRVNPGMAVRPPLAWELELAEGCLRAIPRFLARSDQRPARMTVPVATGDVTLELRWL